MQPQLSQGKAKLHVAIIAIFYLISGAWEYLMALMQVAFVPYGTHSLLDAYRTYSGCLGLIAILLGILLLFRFNFIRMCTVVLTWWNLLAAPLIMIWWYIYAIEIKAFLATDSWFNLSIKMLAVALVFIIIRLYIIKMLNTSKAGYIFLRNKPEVD